MNVIPAMTYGAETLTHTSQTKYKLAAAKTNRDRNNLGKKEETCRRYD